MPSITAAEDVEERFLRTRRGALTLLLLCAVQFLDILDILDILEASLFLLAAAVVALRAAQIRGEPHAAPDPDPVDQPSTRLSLGESR